MSLAEKNISNVLLCEIQKVLMENISSEDIGQFRRIQTFVEPRVYISGIPTYNPPIVEYMETNIKGICCTTFQIKMSLLSKFKK